MSEGEKKERKKPERLPSDPEMLAMGRCVNVIRHLGLDPGAMMRVAHYLLNRADDEVKKQQPRVAGKGETGTLFE